MDQFVEEVNEAIREGKVLLKLKTLELILRLVCVLYVFNYIMGELLVSVFVIQFLIIIFKVIFESVVFFVNYFELQKDIFCQVNNYFIIYLY